MHQRRPLWYTGFSMGTELDLWFQGRNLLELGIGMHCTITINIPPSMEGLDGWITKMASISFSLFSVISSYRIIVMISHSGLFESLE